MADAPELRVVPIEDLDKIEKLLDVALNTVNMPNLPAIKQACMDELVQINATMAEAQTAALETYRKELADWEAKNAAEAKLKAQEEERKAQAKEKSYA